MKYIWLFALLGSVVAEARNNSNDLICQATKVDGAWIMKDPLCAKYNTKFILTPQGTPNEKIVSSNDIGTQPLSCVTTIDGVHKR